VAVRLTVWVEGRVQGVGFRWWTRREADALGLSGSASNLADGRVEVIAEGSQDACESLLALLQGDRTPGYVQRVTYEWADPDGLPRGFRAR